MRQEARCFTDSRPASVDRTPERAVEPLTSLSPLRLCFATRLRGRRTVDWTELAAVAIA
jgi:hypothetical protein